MLAPQDRLLFNLDISPGETRNPSLTAFPDVVAKLTALKVAHEAEPDIFGPSEVHRGSNANFEPCSAQAVARGCRPGGGGRTPGHPVPDWPPVTGFSTAHETLATGRPYKTHQCNASSNSSEAALACEEEAEILCLADNTCGGFALCDWDAKCAQEAERGVVSLFTAVQVAHVGSGKPFWTLWQKHGASPPAPLPGPLAGLWPLCCQQEWGGV